MGEVYRAHDPRLKRDVAIKVLPEAFAGDGERIARFRREAEVLAALNHPNIGAVYGFEETPRGSGIVLELVEGQTLAERLARGPMPLDEALTVASHIAAAVAAAHERGVTHRDLKPANIKVAPDGRVKVLDFGLAKLADAAITPDSHDPAVHPLLSVSPTMASPAAVTGVGSIIGTAAYMSPEQARGRPVDRRTDVWAFGCVLYEMLTGRRVFEGAESVSDAIAAVLTSEPDWTRLPASTPPQVRTLLRRCLQRDPERRLHHLGDARLELEDALTGSVIDPAGDAGARSGLWLLRAVPLFLAALAAAVAAWAIWSRPASPTPEARPPVRLELNLPPGMELFTASARTVAISPAGSRVAFIGGVAGTRQVYVRELDHFDITALRGTEGATACFFSPDGESIAFVTAAGVLGTVNIEDGLVTRVADRVSFLYGAAWTPDDRIIFVRDGRLWHMARAGGVPSRLIDDDDSSGDLLQAWPQVLPGGSNLLFAVGSGDAWRIDLLVLATGERRTLVDRGTLPLYANSGHVLFFRDGELFAAPFDAGRAEVTGPAVRALENLPAVNLGIPTLDIASTGTLVYAPTTAVRRLVWVTRDGVEQPLNDELRTYASPKVSPDGRRILVQAGDLWVQDLSRDTFTRLVSRDAVTNGFPIWSPDGQRVLFRTPRGIRIIDANGGSDGELVRGTSEYDYPGALTPDGSTLVFLRSLQESSFDVFALPLRAPEEIRALLQTPAYEGGARLSPDGRWLSYVSNETGQNEVYLRPFQGLDRRWQVSAGGGTQAIWNPDGREIFYRSGERMMVVGFATDPEVTLTSPRLLFEQQYAYGAGITIANYDVTPDGQRFVMVKDEATAGRLNVVLNWFSDLAR
jgi:serine/threonine-protein kinase